MEYLKNNFKKILVGIFVLVIVVEAGYGIWTLTKPVSTYLPSAAKPQKVGGKIILLAAKKDYKVGDLLPVTIEVTTGSKPTVGTDVVIRYNPKILEASSGAFEKGTLYSDYSRLSIDRVTGIVEISGFRGINEKPVLGTGVFGKINFKVRGPGTTRLSIDFTPPSTADSNIFEAGKNKDILEIVTNLDVTTVLK